MYKLICVFVIGLCAVYAQENAMANVPKSLLECYNNTYLLDRNNKLPQNIPSLLALIRKIENIPGLNMDLRTLSIALLHRFRQDGIVQNPFVPVQDGVTPYAPNGVQFYRHAETLRLIPGNAMAFPNNSLTSVERCSLHSMLSNTIEIMERGDESTTCRIRNSEFRHPRRWRRYSATESSKLIDDVETLTDDQLETMGNKDEKKDNGVDPNSWYPPLPPNHPNSARVLAIPPASKCPVESGVIKTDWGTVAFGSVLAGIAAGLQPQDVRLGDLLKEEWQSRDALSSTTLDNKWMATIAGNLAEVALRQGPLADKPLNIGVDGHWNSSELPHWYFLNSNEDLFYTAAEIRGDLDGLILATIVADWYSKIPKLKLSQIIDMYYSDRGFFNSSIKACNRKNLLASFALNSTTTEQTYRSALVLSPGVAKVTIDPPRIEKFAAQATQKLFTFIPSSLNDPPCDDLTRSSKFTNRITTDISIFIDTKWPFDMIHPILGALLYKLDISIYNSNYTIINAYDGSVMIENTNDILTFVNFNESYYSNYTKGFDISKSFDKIRSLATSKLNDEKNRGLGGGKSQVILIIPYSSTISDTDKEYCLEQLKKLREDAPDVTFKFLTRGSKDTWADLVKDTNKDIFSIPASSTKPELSGPITGLITSIQEVPNRLINSQCGASYDKSGSSSSYDDYLEPSGIKLYRMNANYFHTDNTDNVPTIKIQGSNSASLTVCTSRSPLDIDIQSGSCTTITSSESHSVKISCEDATYIHQCNPFYMTVSVNVSANAVYQCTDDRYCRYADTVKYTISYDNLVCTSGAKSILLSPITILLIIVYSYLR